MSRTCRHISETVQPNLAVNNKIPADLRQVLVILSAFSPRSTVRAQRRAERKTETPMGHATCQVDYGLRSRFAYPAATSGIRLLHASASGAQS
jgi:hypothetical protein